jgi:oligosaccharide repeat unit polymerase
VSTIVLGVCAISFLTYVLFFFPASGGISQYLDPGSGLFGSVDTLRGAGIARAAILLASVGFFIAVVHFLLRSSPRPSDLLLVLLAGSASVVATALSRNRVFLVWDLAVPVVILHYTRRRIRVPEALLGITALFVITVVFTVAIRSPQAFSSRTGSGFLASIADFYVVQTGEMSVVSDIAERQASTLGYLDGATLVASAVNVIPRAIWSDKPSTAGETYTQYFMPDVWRRGSTFLGVPWQGELLLNGGLPALVLGGFLTGLLFGLLYRRIWAKPTAVGIALRGLFSFSLFLLITRGSLEFYSFTLVWGVPLVLGILILTKRPPSTNLQSSAAPMVGTRS